MTALVLVTSAGAASAETFTVYTEYGMLSPTGSGRMWLDTGITLLGGTVTVTGGGQATNCDHASPTCRNRNVFGPDGNGRGFCAATGYVCTAPNLSAYAPEMARRS